MKSLVLASLLVLTGIVSSQNLTKTKPNLELRLKPGKGLNGVPGEFTFKLVNISDHDVFVPKPKVDCNSSLNGYIWLQLDFTPARSNDSGSGFGCIEDQAGVPPIMERVKDWQLLHPGEAVTQTLGHQNLHYDDKGAGTYEFWAEYHPPAIASQDQGTLREAGMAFPRQDDLKTMRFVYRKR